MTIKRSHDEMLLSIRKGNVRDIDQWIQISFCPRKVNIDKAMERGMLVHNMIGELCQPQTKGYPCNHVSMIGETESLVMAQAGETIVTHSVAKDFLGSAKTRWVILTERPTSFWAQWSRDEVMSFLGSEEKNFPRFVGLRSETQAHYYCEDREYRYTTKYGVFNQMRNAHRPSCVNMRKENRR